MMKTLIPENQQELDNWMERLKAAGKTYQLVPKDNKVVLLIDEADEHLLIERPQQTQTITQPKKKKVSLGLVIVGVVVFFGVVGSLLPSTAEPSREADSKKEETVLSETPSPAPEPEIDIKQNLKEEIESLSSKSFDGSGYRGTVESIQLELALFQSYAQMINDAQNSTDIEAIELSQKLKEKVQKVQIAEFPKMRKAYGEIVHDKLWAENIETAVLGKGNRTIQFTGGALANNKNKQAVQDALREMLGLLRFKRANYKWYKYDDEYTYYTMSTADDGDIVDLRDSSN